MSVSSMTGFARSAGAFDGLHWQWEIKSVNGKALDVRCRLPGGFEALEPLLRQSAAAILKRGSIQVSLTVSEAARGESIKLNRAVLDQVLAAAEAVRDRIGGEPLRADALIALRGVLEVVPEEMDEAELKRRDAAMAQSFDQGLRQLDAARKEEGGRLAVILEQQIARVENLTLAARDNPARSADAIKTRLKEQVAKLIDASSSLDEDRLHQEAVLAATRGDIQEEIDRLFSHVASARSLLRCGGAIGRKLDFLTQEFNREANTLCSKSFDTSLTATGLDLKTVIDQMREQVQNIE